VTLSEQKPFRRKFGEVYDGWKTAKWTSEKFFPFLQLPKTAKRSQGYQVYAWMPLLTNIEEAETLRDRRRVEGESD